MEGYFGYFVRWFVMDAFVSGHPFGNGLVNRRMWRHGSSSILLDIRKGSINHSARVRQAKFITKLIP